MGHKMEITELLAFSVKKGASDSHISAGLSQRLRIDGDVQLINLPPMAHQQVHSLIYGIMNDKQRRYYDKHLEADFASKVPGIARIRVNTFNQHRGAAPVFRAIASNILTLQQLCLPDLFRQISRLSRGLILVTGPTGSGKSTTLAARVNHINEHRQSHTITIEDPIEFCHQSKKCLVSQREVYRDTLSFDTARRAVSRFVKIPM